MLRQAHASTTIFPEHLQPQVWRALGGFLSCREPPECMGHYADAPEDNLLGNTDKQQLNKEEARGVVRAEAFLLDLELLVALTTGLLLDIHRVAFGHLYDWAGQWRRSNPNVGSFVPPPFQQVPTIGGLFQPIRICGATGRNVSLRAFEKSG